MINQDISWLLQEKYHGQECKAFLDDCARIQAGEPLGYVIGQVPFLDCQIWLDSKPLIPRPETEHWTEQVIHHLKKLQTNQPTPIKVLDLCAGSGAIGVAIAHAVPHAHITWAELDASHLATIQKNVRANSTIDDDKAHNYHVVVSDLFDQVSGVFDVIVTNPPYIDAAADTVTESVTAHEPHLALFGGEKGMEIIATIINQAAAYLTPKVGQLWIEHEPFQCEAIAQLATQAGFICTHHQDQYHTVRYSILSWPMAV